MVDRIYQIFYYQPAPSLAFAVGAQFLDNL